MNDTGFGLAPVRNEGSEIGPDDVLHYSATQAVIEPLHINASGITPTEFKVLILPSPTEEVTKGGIIVPIDKVDKDKYATTDGVLVAMSHLAFTYVTDEEWGDQKPKPGMKVVFAKYAGSRRKGKDGLDYILINDKDIVATIED